MKFLMIICVCLLVSVPKVLAQESVCYGTTLKGYLVNGVELPSSGENFVSYSFIARLAGRTYVHSTVNNIIIEAYQELAIEQPSKIYKYAETGLEEGGQFKPHKSHRNGLSVDFMTPVIDDAGVSVHLPTHPFNRFGYDIEFDNANQFDDYRIDFEAIAAHLVALHQAAIKHGVDLGRITFDPKLQPELFKTHYADYLTKHLKFSTKPAWVRHDEHYHVDFAVPCQAYDKKP